MVESEMNVVTGAYGFSGKSITRLLLDKGKAVKTLTGHPGNPDEFNGNVEALPYNFDNPAELTKSLEKATVLYNTYWIRFEHDDLTFDKAIRNTKTLIKAAEDAGVRRIVHVSITNPSLNSPFPYFSGKAAVEKAISESKLSYTILRPAVLFGNQGILINNIAWFLRHLPAFAVPGDGNYHIQPIYVEDLAELAVAAGERDDNAVMDAVGPETFTFNDLIQIIRAKIGSNAAIIHLNPYMACLGSSVLGKVLGDVVLTKDEVQGLMANLLVSNKPPTGHTPLSEWIAYNADWLGTTYFSEIKKHFK